MEIFACSMSKSGTIMRLDNQGQNNNELNRRVIGEVFSCSMSKAGTIFKAREKEKDKNSLSV